MNKKIRVRFAPSPTGGLHLGGVRTALFNYLFAKQQGGNFIVRIEDTDQTRFVAGAEAYIFNTLAWCGIVPDESPIHNGPHAPYRQSERKPMYAQYALQLIESGCAYYAFDTPDELEQMRTQYKTAENPAPQYNHHLRSVMRNSLTLAADEVADLLATGTPYVIRIKMPVDESISFTDLIRGEVRFNTSQIDDKVLLKADGMPTYHLAVVVDDYAMQISHAFRGEEWLPSAPVHILLWKYLGWEADMPQWAHLPLILKPDGHGKLSKRDGDRLGFPVFAMDWLDAKTNEITAGFKERGFLPEAFTNLLVMLGWNNGSDQEIFSMNELIEKFSMDRVHKAGAKFDYEKAKWFNQEWIKKTPAVELLLPIKTLLIEHEIFVPDDVVLLKVIELVKDRCVLLNDFMGQCGFFFKTPESFDTESIKPKWDHTKKEFFIAVISKFELQASWVAAELETLFKEQVAAHQLKAGELMLPLRIMLVGGKFGPGVFDIAEIIGKTNTLHRINWVVSLLELT